MDLKQGYRLHNFNMPIKRFCQTLDLKNDVELINEYKRLHSPEGSWSIIRDGIRSVGILEMEIYIWETKLFMIVETPLDFQWDNAMKKLSKLPMQVEWENLVSKFQECKPGMTSDDKWKLMERIFYLYD